jgi:ATP-binding cassette subfamily C protein CydD
LDTLQGLREMKLLGQSQGQAERVTLAAEQYRLTTMNVLRVTFLSALVLEMVGTISTAVIAVQIGLRLLQGQMIFEQAFFILLLAPEFYLPLRLLGQRFHAGVNGLQAARRIFEILNTPGLTEPIGSDFSALNSLPSPRQIRFDHVSYTYPGQTHPAVEDVSFELHHGQMTALVGASGAGKSTLASLLLRFSLPTSGQVLVDGDSLECIPSAMWRQTVAWVPQLPVIFRKSIAENIALGNPRAQLADIQSAARQAFLDERIMALTAGYDTVLGEGGARLSGGELQRLALARAFLLDAPLLVLDEPTAHLDLTQEALLEGTVRSLCSGRTVLVIAHRLPTVYRADKILVLDHGRIVETGSHQSLSAVDGPYSRLLRLYRGVTV